MLQCAAVCCSVWQCVAMYCSVLCCSVCCSVWQCVAVRRSVLQCVVLCGSMLQCVTVRGSGCSVLRSFREITNIEGFSSSRSHALVTGCDRLDQCVMNHEFSQYIQLNALNTDWGTLDQCVMTHGV